MKIGKKALSLVLALTMVVSSFAGTAAFAESHVHDSDSRWFDSNVSDSSDSNHIVDSSNAWKGVDFKKSEYDLNQGTPKNLADEIQVTKANGTLESLKDSSYIVSGSWKSSEEGFATVNQDGVVTAVAAGQTTITVLVKGTQRGIDDHKDSNHSVTWKLSCLVTVPSVTPVDVPVTKVTLNKTTLSLEKGTTEKLQATVAPSNATAQNITWVSYNKNIATVDKDGLVTAVAGGLATIRATTANNKFEDCKVTVTVSATGIKLNETALTLRADSDGRRLSATITPSDTTDDTVIWTSSNSGVANVSNHGFVSPVAVGTTNITATTLNGKSATCLVTIRAVTPEDTAGDLQDLSNATTAIHKLPPVSEYNKLTGQDLEDAKTKIKDAVSGIVNLNEAMKHKLNNADIAKLETLLETLAGGKGIISAPVAAAEIKDSGRMTEAPTVSGLLLAAGVDGYNDTEAAKVKLETIQIVPTGDNSILAFELNLTDDGEAIHDLAIPVTVKFKLPDSFTYSSSYTYTIRHDYDDDGKTFTKSLPLTISGGYASFTTSSFSTFTVVGTKDGYVPGKKSHSSHSGGGSGSFINTAVTDITTNTAATFVSDTTTNFNVNGAYQFKITSKNGQVPTLVVGTAGVFNTQLVKTVGNDYYFKLTAIGNTGAKAGIFVNGVKLLVATVTTPASTVKSDTTGSFKVKAGKTYTFKITAATKPTFVSGTSSAFKAEFVKAVGKDYFFKVTAVGKAGTGTGFYVNAQKAPVAAATIIK